jgi:hypothetical protein
MAEVFEKPTVFIGSSTESLPLARSVREIIGIDANVLVWDVAFDLRTWTLQAILDYSQKCDSGVFVMAPDDASVIRAKEGFSVRDNVLFEIGVFMGSLGPRRTFVLWPAEYSSKLRFPSDLSGLTTVNYQKGNLANSTDLKGQLAPLRKVIVELGPALRNSYNEIEWIDHLEEQREQVFDDDSSESFKEISRPTAARRKTPWFPKTPVDILLTAISDGYDDSTVDNIFWWLIVDGVITFDNIDVWTSDDEFHWSTSADYAVFTDRGVAWLNHLRSERVS